MNLSTFKDDVNKAGFSEEALGLINAILDKAIKRGSLEKEERDEIGSIMDIEIGASKLEVDTKKKVIAALNELAGGIESAIDQALAELLALDSNSQKAATS